MQFDMETLLDTLSACVRHQQAGETAEAEEAGVTLMHLLGLGDLLRETAVTRLGDYSIHAPPGDGGDDGWIVVYGITKRLGEFPTRSAAMAALMKHRNDPNREPPERF